MVGIVHVASALLVASDGAGRARVRRDGHDCSDGGTQLVRNVPGVCQFWLGSRSFRPSQGISSLYVSGISSDSTLCGGEIPWRFAGGWNSGRILRDGNLLGLGNYGQRDLPYCGAGAGAWLHLQRSTHAEFGRAAGDWAGRAGEGIELGFLFVRGGIFAGGADDHAVAGDQGENAGVREAVVSV